MVRKRPSTLCMPATQLQDFYQRWYHPSNMRLMVIGDIVPQEVATEIARQFGALPVTTMSLACNSN
ncbi:MAG: insulinase family protein [Symbiopectobacterium sp.]